MRPIGFKACYLLKGPKSPQKLQKLNARASIGYLIGYEGAKKFRIWNPLKDLVIITRDIMFDENFVFNPKDSPYDPLLIKKYNILKSIDESSNHNSMSIIYPHQLINSSEEKINWTSIFDN